MQDLILPAQKIDAGDEYEGATVIDPVKGYTFLQSLIIVIFSILC